ncbi:hypothetical protein N0V94_002946 [Neodidymelliopsis sp. IMI 364377]|nr:hypothetical protein N0V94_002946 [Neodidymelliopsis sp. IMI 364377]
MAPSRAFVPSVALIRALSRPQPLRCPVPRLLPARFVRGKKTKAAKARVTTEREQLAQQARKIRHEQTKETDSKPEIEHDPEIDKELQKIDKFEKQLKKKIPKNSQNSKIFEALTDYKKLMKKIADQSDEEFWEGARPPDPYSIKDDESPGRIDPTTGRPLRRANKHGTLEQRIRDSKRYEMMTEYLNNPNYDMAGLNKLLLDEYISDPQWAPFVDELKDLRASIFTREEIDEVKEQAEKEADLEMDMNLRDAIRETVTELIDDPHVGSTRGALQAVLDKLPITEDINSPEFRAILDQATTEVTNNEKLQQRLKESVGKPDPKFEKEWTNFEKQMSTSYEPEEVDGEYEEEYIEKLVNEIQEDVGLGGDMSAKMEAELRKDPYQNLQFPEDRDPEELAMEIAQFITEHKGTSTTEANPSVQVEEKGQTQAQDEEEEDEENISPEVRKQVDIIMKDPKLIEKLLLIKKRIAARKAPPPAVDPSDLTQIDHSTAPDPYALSAEQTASLAERMELARADPEHRVALRNLRVKLPAPFSVSPALKSFNQALEYAYIGANDDVRRVLWRSYQKARSLPTFLQNLSDDAWDIVYYSQAVKWTGNQNRTAHLKMVLGDMKRVGRNGPPTHPASLGVEEEEE